MRAVFQMLCHLRSGGHSPGQKSLANLDAVHGYLTWYAAARPRVTTGIDPPSPPLANSGNYGSKACSQLFPIQGVRRTARPCRNRVPRSPQLFLAGAFLVGAFLAGAAAA